MSSDGAGAQSATRVVLRPVASSVPVGFLGLAAGTILLSGQQLGWVPVAESSFVAASILALAVPMQGLASVVGFLARDPVVSTGMAVLATTWAMTGVLNLMGSPGSRSAVLGLALFFLSVAVLLVAGVAALSKGLAAIVLGLAGIRFALSGLYEYLGGTGWQTAAGWVGVVLCALAIAAAAAFAYEDARRTDTGLTLRRGPGRQALTGEGLDTVGPVARDAGVRDQL